MQEEVRRAARISKRGVKGMFTGGGGTGGKWFVKRTYTRTVLKVNRKAEDFLLEIRHECK